MTESERHTRLEKDGNVLEIPKVKYWGSSDVYFNNNKIPGAKLWEICAAFLAHGKKVPENLLFEEAKRAEVYRLLDSGQIVYTTTPREGDIPKAPSIFVRMEKQRVRTLVKRFNIKIAKIEGELTSLAIRELCIFCAGINLHPVAYQENRIYFCEDPQKVYDTVGSTCPIRLAVYCKRPSSSSFKVILK